MTNQINVGDLVYAHKGCPRCGTCLGAIFRVESFQHSGSSGYQCGACFMSPAHPPELGVIGDIYRLPISFVRKLKGGEDALTEQRDEQLEAV